MAAFLTLVSSAFAQPIADGVYVIKFAAKPDYVLTLRDGNADNVNPDWSASSYPLKNVNNTDDRGWENWLVNDISAADWNRRLEPAGAVFLPCAGNRGDVNYNDGINGGGTGPEGQLPFAGFYWASTIANFFPDDHGNDSAYMLYFSIDGWNGTVNPRYTIWPCIGCSVRLVTDNQ